MWWRWMGGKWFGFTNAIPRPLLAACYDVVNKKRFSNVLPAPPAKLGLFSVSKRGSST